MTPAPTGKADGHTTALPLIRGLTLHTSCVLLATEGLHGQARLHAREELISHPTDGSAADPVHRSPVTR